MALTHARPSTSRRSALATIRATLWAPRAVSSPAPPGGCAHAQPGAPLPPGRSTPSCNGGACMDRQRQVLAWQTACQARRFCGHPSTSRLLGWRGAGTIRCPPKYRLRAVLISTDCRTAWRSGVPHCKREGCVNECAYQKQNFGMLTSLAADFRACNPEPPQLHPGTPERARCRPC